MHAHKLLLRLLSGVRIEKASGPFGRVRNAERQFGVRVILLSHPSIFETDILSVPVR